jgi:hypothetical protein
MTAHVNDELAQIKQSLARIEEMADYLHVRELGRDFEDLIGVGHRPPVVEFLDEVMDFVLRQHSYGHDKRRQMRADLLHRYRSALADEPFEDAPREPSTGETKSE